MMSKHGFSNKSNLPSNHKFGLFFVFLFSAVAAYAYFMGWGSLAPLALVVAVLMAVVTIFFAQMLSPLNRLWYNLGILLGMIVSPVVLGLIFLVLITPVSIVARLFGRDELKLKKRNVDSYWIDRSQPSLTSDSFKNQF